MHVRMRTRGHASEKKAEDGEEVEAAEERMEKEDEKRSPNMWSMRNDDMLIGFKQRKSWDKLWTGGTAPPKFCARSVLGKKTEEFRDDAHCPLTVSVLPSSGERDFFERTTRIVCNFYAAVVSRPLQKWFR